MPAMLRAAALTDFAAVAESLGLEPLRLLRQVGLDPACLANPDMRIASAQVAELLEAAAKAGGVEDFGLRLAAKRGLANLGPLGLIARDAASVREALESMTHYMRLHNESLGVRLLPGGEGLAVLRLDYLTGTGAASRQSGDLALGVLFRSLKLFLGERWQAELVCFAHAAPRRLSAHRRFFGERLQFSAPADQIVCRAGDLGAPVAASDPRMARYVRAYLDSLLGRASTGLPDQVRELATLLLPQARCQAEVVAAQLGLNRRTLDRRLGAAGTSFLSIVNAVRGELAAGYAQEGLRSRGEIAGLLGFASLSAFSRWDRAQGGDGARKQDGRTASPRSGRPPAPVKPD